MTPRDLAEATPERPIRLGRYDVTGLIRAGGMGTVHDAVDREHGTRVALKTLNHLGATSLLRFKSEFRQVADLSHPNLVSLYELSCHEDLWFFTMERIEGVDLIRHLRGQSARELQTLDERPDLAEPTARERGLAAPAPRHPVEPAASMPRALPELRDAFRQLAEGVRALHAAGLLHLDIKPSNVLVDRAGRVVLLDFGLVRTIDSARAAPASESSSISGTPTWMAPEQHVGVAIGAAADWYAVGLLLYFALTGVLAFAPTSMELLSFAKHHSAPTRPDKLLPGLPADLSALTVALLHSVPASRPTGEAIASLLSSDARQGATSGAGPRAARPPLVGRAPELALVRDAFRRVRESGTAVVHLAGPSGVGKTALLASLLDEIEPEALVLRGRCYERESVPYKAFDGIVDELVAQLSAPGGRYDSVALPAWIAELSRVFPVLASVPFIAARLDGRAPISTNVPVIEVRRRAVCALRELFTSIAALRPLVLAIDDLHWADADSAALLVKLLEAPAPPGLLLAASFRPTEAALGPDVAAYFEAVAGPGLRPGRGAIGLLSIDVGPLPRDQAERLADATLAALGVAPEGLAAVIAEEAAGIPFYVEELARFVAQQRESGVAAGPVDVALESVLGRRVQALAGAERALVEVLAVANSPVLLSVAFAAAGVGTEGVRRALWSLRSGHFVRSTASGAGERVELHHDGMRESVLRALSPERVVDLHLALGRALRERDADAFLFDAVRHLNSARARLAGAERASVAALDLAAGRRARRAAAFPLAFRCFRAGIELLEADAWGAQYGLALALHGGAAETAYLSATWGELGTYVASVKAHGRTIFDQLVAWEVQIDASIARREYGAAVDEALEALRLIGVELPAHPSEAEVGAGVKEAMEALGRVGPAGLSALAPAADPGVTAAMRVQARISSATYFARPMLFPLIACRLVTASVAHGLSPATPYALSVYGVVLNTLGMHQEAHTWGRVALDLLARFEDRSLEARTRHVVLDLTCTWIVPLRTTLDDLRDVVAVGKDTGDLEYAAYAAHAYVHNAFYAARELGGLLEEALAFGEFMRGYEQVNALHVHAPFEQALRCFVGRAESPASLNGSGFDEHAALELARASGSRSAQCIVRLLMGVVRYHFGSVVEASACLEAARPFLDGVMSTWHTPIFHQYAALAIHALPDTDRRNLRDAADASLAALRALAGHCAENFAHRVLLVEAESARADGDLPHALELCGQAARAAREGGWTNDLALASELASRCHAAGGEVAEAARVGSPGTELEFAL